MDCNTVISCKSVEFKVVLSIIPMTDNKEPENDAVSYLVAEAAQHGGDLTANLAV